MYIHVCQNEACPHCNWWGCYCKMQHISNNGNIQDLCPECGQIIHEVTITTSETILNDLNVPKGNEP